MNGTTILGALEPTCVVVLGSGRSGTSLATQLISTLGVVIDSSGGSAGDQNPSGFFEDPSIVELNKQILYNFSVSQYFPNELTGWEGSNEYRVLKRSLGEYVSNRSKEHHYWGFKDPRTAFLLPSYRSIFNRSRIVPRYVLCVRNPANVVASLVANYGDDPGLAQLVWFSKNLTVLRETGLNCFLLHYEKLIEEPLEQVAALQRFIFEGAPHQEIDREAVLRVTRTDLDRSSTIPYRITNPYVDQLYNGLAACNGTDFDRDALRDLVRRLSEIEEAFLPWPRVAGRTAGLLRRERDRARADAARLERERGDADGETKEQERRCQESLAQAATATRERDDAVASVAALQERLDSAESAAAAWKLERSSLEVQCADVVRENARLSRDMIDARVVLEEYQARIVTLEAELTKLSALVRTAEQRAREKERLAPSNPKLSEMTSYAKLLERKHLAILQSTSWRMTAPVRRLLQALKGREQNKAFVPKLLDPPTARTRSSTADPRK